MYLAVNKDTDELYSERVNADADEARRLLNKAAQIFAAEPPPGVSTKPDWYECKMCDHYDLCHGTAARSRHAAVARMQRLSLTAHGHASGKAIAQ